MGSCQVGVPSGVRRRVLVSVVGGVISRKILRRLSLVGMVKPVMTLTGYITRFLANMTSRAALIPCATVVFS